MYLLTSRTLVSVFDGRVTWRKWAAARRRSEHSDLVESHAALLVKGSLDVPSKMSLMVMWRTTESSCWFMKVQIWQVGLSKSGAFWLAMSEGRMAWPEMCLMETWKRLAVDKNVETLELAENSPLHSFSYTEHKACCLFIGNQLIVPHDNMNIFWVVSGYNIIKWCEKLWDALQKSSLNLSGSKTIIAPPQASFASSFRMTWQSRFLLNTIVSVREVGLPW